MWRVCCTNAPFRVKFSMIIYTLIAKFWVVLENNSAPMPAEGSLNVKNELRLCSTCLSTGSDIISERLWFLCVFFLCSASWNIESGDGTSAGWHAIDWSSVCLLPQETSEYSDLWPPPQTLGSWCSTEQIWVWQLDEITRQIFRTFEYCNINVSCLLWVNLGPFLITLIMPIVLSLGADSSLMCGVK